MKNQNESWEVKITLDSERYQNIPTHGGLEHIIAMIRSMDNWIQDFDLILVDSGAATNCCPPDYGMQFPSRSGVHQPLRPATGQRVSQYGFRRVQYYCEDGGSLSVDYTVADVRKPIMSMGQLVEGQHTVASSKDRSYIMRDTRGLDLVRDNHAFFLKFRQKEVELNPMTKEPGVTMNEENQETSRTRPAKLNPLVDRRFRRSRRMLNALHMNELILHSDHGAGSCVSGRGKEGPRRSVPFARTENGMTVFQMDYGFTGTTEDEATACFLNCASYRTGILAACEVPKTGPETYQGQFIPSFLDTVGENEVILQTDQEEAGQACRLA